MQRNFGPLKQQVEEWRALRLPTAAAKLLNLPGVHRGKNEYGDDSKKAVISVSLSSAM